MPHVRLSKDHKGRKAGTVVSLSDAQYQAALDARAVAKTYPGPVPTVSEDTQKPAKKATKKAAAPQTPASAE